MSFKKILVTTDFSQQSRAALDVAEVLARANNASVRIVHVIGGVDMLDETFGSWLLDGDTARIRRMLEKLSAGLTSVACDSQLLHGRPADEIVRLAREGEFDLIIMGTHGRGGLSRLMLGSVAETVLRRAGCPVLTIRDPNAANDDRPVARDSISTHWT